MGNVREGQTSQLTRNGLTMTESPVVSLREHKNGQNRPDRDSLENTHLREKIQLLESLLDDLKADRDHWRQQATALLTHQQQPPAEMARLGLWRRLFGSR